MTYDSLNILMKITFLILLNILYYLICSLFFTLCILNQLEKKGISIILKKII